MATTHYGTFPILLPGKTESVSRNGLKLTSGTILFKPEQEIEALALAEQYGSVFPAPEIRTTDFGLIEMSFDAYSDTATTASVKNSLLVRVSKTIPGFIQETVNVGTTQNPVNVTVTKLGSGTVVETWIVDAITIYRVLSAASGSSQIPSPTLTLTRSLKRRDIVGQIGSLIPGGPAQSSILTIAWTQVMSDVTRRNFGTLDEVDVTFTLEASVA